MQIMKAYVVVDCRDDDCANHKDPIGEWHVDLVMEARARVDGLDVWRVGHPHDLRQELEYAGDHGLACHNCGHDCDDHAEVEAARRDSVEEWVRVRRLGLISGNECGLTDVGKDEAGVGEAEPGKLYGPLSESSKVGEEGFNAGEGQQ